MLAAGITSFLCERDLFVPNLQAPVPVIETLFLNVSGGGHVDNPPSVLLKEDRITGKQRLFLH